MHRLKVISFLFLLFAVLSLRAQSPFAGMNGKEILERIRSDYRPEKTLSDEEIRAAISAYAYTPGSGFRDYFSADALSQLSTIHVVPLKWWSDTSEDFAAVRTELHNIVPANLTVAANREDFPPGVVSEIIYDNGYWRAGIGTISGMTTNFYEPADHLKGDFARIYMFMAAVYPQALWQSRAPMLYLDGYYPLLTPYGRSILLDWHRADPVDDAELKRDNAIASAQGNSNPFVSDPELAEYIWGSNADKIYNPGQQPEQPTDPDQPVAEPIMLKAVYSVANDGRIDFLSPYVAAGSEWKFDGAPVSASLNLSDVCLGRHEISYSNERSRGKIIITVEP